jgi:DMSO/TMAO reductase YedYZ molybdopterin-dependent catalytic subunit
VSHGSRRQFLQSSLCLSGSLLLGCEDEPVLDRTCGEFWPGATRVGTASFVNEGDAPLGSAFGDGLDGRLLTDLSTLGPQQLVTPSEQFYIRTRSPDRLGSTDGWKISVSGLVEPAHELALDELLPLEEPMGEHLLECSGNSRAAHFGLLSSARFHGISLAKVLARLPLRTSASALEVGGFDDHSTTSAGGHSTPGASWIFAFDQLVSAGAFFATRMNDAPLTLDHGFPVRLFVPGWYGCTAIKWVDSLRLVDENEPATSQMIEFAARTHQTGVPALARDYRPATLEHAAMPIRIEKWRRDSRVAYRVVGIAWGGSTPVQALAIRFGDAGWQRVPPCSKATTTRTWALWSHRWQPTAPGTYAIRLKVDDPLAPQRRLDSGYYVREVGIDEV